MGIIGQGVLLGAAQSDSLSEDLSLSGNRRGIIRVRKPEIKPRVEVLTTHFLIEGSFQNATIEKNRVVSFVNDKNNTSSNGALFAEPALVDVPTPEKYLRMTEPGTFVFDLDSFFTENLGLMYPFTDVATTDTVKLLLRISKKGSFTFQYREQKKTYSTAEQKGFETMGHVKTWTPSKMLIYSGDAKKLRRRKKMNSIVYVTLLVHIAPPPGNFTQLWDEASGN